jgi:hypothetical protein
MHLSNAAIALTEYQIKIIGLMLTAIALGLAIGKIISEQRAKKKRRQEATIDRQISGWFEAHHANNATAGLLSKELNLELDAVSASMDRLILSGKITRNIGTPSFRLK